MAAPNNGNGGTAPIAPRRLLVPPAPVSKEKPAEPSIVSRKGLLVGLDPVHERKKEPAAGPASPGLDPAIRNMHIGPKEKQRAAAAAAAARAADLMGGAPILPGIVDPPLAPITKEAALAAVREDGLALQSRASRFWYDPDVVLAAVQQNGLALKHARSDLLHNRDIVLAAVKSNGKMFQMVPPTLVDRSLALTAVGQSGGALHYLPDEFRSDPEVVKVAMKTFPKAIIHALGEARFNKELLFSAWRSGVDIKSLPLDQAEYLGEAMRSSGGHLFSKEQEREEVLLHPLSIEGSNDNAVVMLDELTLNSEDNNNMVKYHAVVGLGGCELQGELPAKTRIVDFLIMLQEGLMENKEESADREGLPRLRIMLPSGEFMEEAMAVESWKPLATLCEDWETVAQ
eukprot:CAMPEP_0206459182 /NCGR_PEP_ID=MMETSP0324_2-20121206/24025_1 /ASSEMBLY_ACC=CAM_ASM_000836 /TAXON_ID=2866 /ORGANISM="Crypthecodinium cohnii, Strain Seligo" /LENGTH=399 /DNA_ID=CAMNT_0053930687 /DNA_START=16 /DNA_END=1215 /DNA_ORIENTATION=+